VSLSFLTKPGDKWELTGLCNPTADAHPGGVDASLWLCSLQAYPTRMVRFETSCPDRRYLAHRSIGCW